MRSATASKKTITSSTRCPTTPVVARQPPRRRHGPEACDPASSGRFAAVDRGYLHTGRDGRDVLGAKRRRMALGSWGHPRRGAVEPGQPRGDDSCDAVVKRAGQSSTTARGTAAVCGTTPERAGGRRKHPNSVEWVTSRSAAQTH